MERPYKTPLYPVPQILASVGMLIAAWYIAPPGLTRGEIYTPFFVMLGISAFYALVWTYGVQRKSPWTPVDPAELKAAEGVEG